MALTVCIWPVKLKSCEANKQTCGFVHPFCLQSQSDLDYKAPCLRGLTLEQWSPTSRLRTGTAVGRAAKRKEKVIMVFCFFVVVAFYL